VQPPYIGNAPQGSQAVLQEKFNAATVDFSTSMDAIWLSDALACRPSRTKSQMTSSRSSPCLGVFTDEPVNIARRLPRPRTPFVPAPQGAHFTKRVTSDDAPSGCQGPELPDSGFGCDCVGFDSAVELPLF
jgi:hypothetical protein